MPGMKKTRTKRMPAESQSVEWKQSLGEWKEIVETCAAFATTKGGTIYVGVTPKGKPAGVTIGNRSLEDLANKIKTNTDPPQYPTIETRKRKGGVLLTVTVEESPVKPFWAFGRPLKRVGRTNQRLKRDEAQRLVEHRPDGRGMPMSAVGSGRRTWMQELCGTSWHAPAWLLTRPCGT